MPGLHGRDALVLALTLAAGYVDAVGYLALGGVFTANMTGNTVLLGLHVSQEQSSAVLRSLLALVGFGGGALMGAMILERWRAEGPWPPGVTWAFAAESVMLTAFALGFALTGPRPEPTEVHGLILLSAVAMGMQSAAARRLDLPGIATTYVTGTLTSAMSGLVAGSRAGSRAAEAPRGATRSGRWKRSVTLQLLSLLVYGLGAMGGGLAHARVTAAVALPPLIVVLAVIAVAARHYRDRS
jgi:uncharacterized membrane protein YoaK (UPF0700 family)